MDIRPNGGAGSVPQESPDAVRENTVGSYCAGANTLDVTSKKAVLFLSSNKKFKVKTNLLDRFISFVSKKSILSNYKQRVREAGDIYSQESKQPLAFKGTYSKNGESHAEVVSNDDAIKSAKDELDRAVRDYAFSKENRVEIYKTRKKIKALEKKLDRNIDRHAKQYRNQGVTESTKAIIEKNEVLRNEIEFLNNHLETLSRVDSEAMPASSNPVAMAGKGEYESFLETQAEQRLAVDADQQKVKKRADRLAADRAKLGPAPAPPKQGPTDDDMMW